MSSTASLDELNALIATCPIIDNHAHNLLLPSRSMAYPFESITSEAGGVALKDAPHSLAHMRAVKQLAQFFNCAEDWDTIKQKRKELNEADETELTKRCLEGTHIILMDDGLDSETVHPYQWHDQFVPAKTKRIVRIETVAEGIIQEMVKGVVENTGRRRELISEEDSADFCADFEDIFTEDIQKYIDDPEVVGFKSVICYRTGLRIESHDYAGASIAHDSVVRAFYRHIQKSFSAQGNRLQDKPLNDYLVASLFKCLTESHEKTGIPIKPVQFHTGLGDSDIDLVAANP
jgi:hypothetical protein